jgi:hypothetical protein
LWSKKIKNTDQQEPTFVILLTPPAVLLAVAVPALLFDFPLVLIEIFEPLVPVLDAILTDDPELLLPLD